MILLALEKLNGDKIMTAKLLGIGKTTLYRKLKEYGHRRVGGMNTLDSSPAISDRPHYLEELLCIGFTGCQGRESWR